MGPDEEASANDLSQKQRMAGLDDAELRDLERTLYKGEAPAVVDDATPATRPRKSFLDRLLRRYDPDAVRCGSRVLPR